MRFEYIYRRQKGFKWAFILTFIPFIIITAGVFFLISYYQYQERINIIKQEEKNTILLAKEIIINEFNTVFSDLKYLANHQLLQQYLLNDLNKGFLEKDFLNFSINKKKYNQIRYINNLGYEVIRINYINNAGFITTDENLQNKSHRYYYKKTQTLEPGQIYVSPFDLNIENQRIDTPYIPVIRISTKVFDANTVEKGILVLNYLGNNLINRLRELDSKVNSRLFLINNDGYFIIGRNSEEEWGFMFKEKKHITFNNIYPEVFTDTGSIIEGQINSKNGIFTFLNLDNHKGDESLSHFHSESIKNLKWKIISYRSSQYFSAIRNSIARRYSILLLFFGIAGAIMSIIFAFTFRNKLEAQLSLNNQLRFIKTLIETIPNPIAFKDSNKKFALFNNGYSTFFNINKKDYYGKVIDDIVPANIAKKINYQDNRVLEEGIISRFEVEFNINKIIKPAIVYKAPVYFKSNDKPGIVSVITDISDQKQIEKELKLANSTKNKFFSIISHDLRGPFSTLIGFIKLLLGEYENLNDSDRLKYLRYIDQSSDSIFRLLENLLYWTRSQLNSIKITPRKIDLLELVNEISIILNNQADSKKIAIENLVRKSTFIYADKNTITTVLRNLISNAIKFTNTGGCVKIYAIEKNEDYVITIEDNGTGIEKSDINNLFRLDTKVQKDGTAKEKGSGLGLLLCKEFIEKNNGIIWVESEVGKGSKFIFNLKSYKA